MNTVFLAEVEKLLNQRRVAMGRGNGSAMFNNNKQWLMAEAVKENPSVRYAADCVELWECFGVPMPNMGQRYENIVRDRVHAERAQHS
jgi:hypothetical protein